MVTLEWRSPSDTLSLWNDNPPHVPLIQRTMKETLVWGIHSRMYSLIAHHENLCTNPNWQPFHRICTLRIYVAESTCFRNVKDMKGLKRYHKHMQQAIWILFRLGHWDLMRVWPLSLRCYVSVLLSGSLSSITAQPSILHPHAQQTQPSLCWECSHGSFSLW